ncbi:helix-turn-helix domain-containing protein [Actinospongicola halichondriae]|uniref:helix-turn-helix domain-containing protein n=1 Tax=Actinospongicola halichondriae TaxID=3236844 RepID=UPI003D4F95AB
MARPAVGDLLREWRHRRNRSQLDLSLDVGVSARHLSFVETGRSRPSPELVLALAEHLDVPLRERNTMLLAAGHAPRFSQTPLDDDAMARVRVSLQRMLDAHDPYPGVVIDRSWNVLLANQAAFAFTEGVPIDLLQPTMNVFRLCLHPDGLASRTTNFVDWATYLLRQMRRTIQLTGDPGLEAIEEEVRAYPNVAALDPPPAPGYWDEPPLLVPFTITSDGIELSMFTTLTTFGTPRDVTLDELAVELFFPADDATDRALVRARPVATSS